MSAFEIVVTVVMCVVGVCNVLLWGNLTLRIDKIAKQNEPKQPSAYGAKKKRKRLKYRKGF